jgi:hypothetical protein
MPLQPSGTRLQADAARRAGSRQQLNGGVRRPQALSVFLVLVTVSLVVVTGCRRTTPQPAPTPFPPRPALYVPTGGIHRIGGPVSAPELLFKPHESWPPFDGGKHRFRGSLFIIDTVVDEEGKLRNARITRSPEITPPWPELEPLLQTYLSKWRYRPATLHGKPVAVRLTLTVDIVLM